MIPKIIHYCWFGGKKLPKDVKKCIKSWKKMCPDYEIVQWNESNFDVNCCKFVEKAYKAKAWAFVSDYARLKIIYDNGGIYLDTDVELKRNLDSLLKEECYFGVQQVGKDINTGLGFGSVKNNNIIKEMLKMYENIDFEYENKEKLACPILNTEVLKKYGYKPNDSIYTIENINVTIYPPKYFDPIVPGNGKMLLDNETFSIHHYSATWTSKTNRIKRKIFSIVGQNNINAIKGIIKNGKN